MKHITTIALLLLTFKLSGQNLPTEITMGMNTIEISYFCKEKHTFQECLLISDSLSFYNSNINDSTTVWKTQNIKDPGILRVKELITDELISKVKKCCAKKKQKNPKCGYIIQKKTNGKSTNIVIDNEYIDLDTCGNNDLAELMEILSYFKNNN